MSREVDVMNITEAKNLIDGNLDESLLDWIDDCIYGRRRAITTETDIRHVAMIIKHIVADLYGIALCGNFGKAVIEGRLEAATLADDICVLYLDVIFKYLYNCVPDSLWSARKCNKKVREEN